MSQLSGRMEGATNVLEDAPEKAADAILLFCQVKWEITNIYIVRNGKVVPDYNTVGPFEV